MEEAHLQLKLEETKTLSTPARPCPPHTAASFSVIQPLTRRQELLPFKMEVPLMCGTYLKEGLQPHTL